MAVAGEKNGVGTMTPEDDASIAELRVATDRLTDQVAQLSSALSVVNSLQIRQLAQDKDLRETKETILPKDDIYERWTEEEQKLSSMRRSTRRFAFLAAFVGIGAAIIFFFVARESTNNAKQAIQTDRHTSCVTKNQQLIDAHTDAEKFLAPFIAKERALKHPDPVIIGVLTLSIDAPPTLTDCSKIG